MRFSTCIENDKSLLSEIKDYKYSKISVDNNSFVVILKFKYLTLFRRDSNFEIKFTLSLLPLYISIIFFKF